MGRGLRPFSWKNFGKPIKTVDNVVNEWYNNFRSEDIWV